MKKIGKEVLFLSTNTQNPRNGEGAMLRLQNGHILYAYTQYCGNDWGDHATARIAAYVSLDEGESWQNRGTLIEKDTNALNIMSVSLISLQNGNVGMLYLKKSMLGDKLLCMPYFCRSADEGRTFGTSISCITQNGYWVVCNDRLTKTRNGRLLFAASYHGDSGYRVHGGELFAVYSDDDGASWNLSESPICSPYSDDVKLAEPGIFELPDGRLWMWCRTAYGHQYQCFSEDGGKTWGPLSPALRFTSPDSPMVVKNVGDLTIAVFNPLAYNCLREEQEVWKSPKRTPLVCAVSKDGGRSFVFPFKTFGNGGFDDFTKDCYLPENNTQDSYCYPALLGVTDGFLIAYYHSNGTGICLNSTKITKVYFHELT